MSEVVKRDTGLRTREKPAKPVAPEGTTNISIVAWHSWLGLLGSIPAFIWPSSDRWLMRSNRRRLAAPVSFRRHGEMRKCWGCRFRNRHVPRRRGRSGARGTEADGSPARRSVRNPSAHPRSCAPRYCEPFHVRNDSPRPVPGAMMAMAPLRAGSPTLSVIRSPGRRTGTALATASRSFMRWTDLRCRSLASVRSSSTQGRLVVFTCPSITGPATSKEAASTDRFMVRWEPLAFPRGKLTVCSRTTRITRAVKPERSRRMSLK